MDRLLSQAAVSIATIMFAAIAALIGAVFVCGAIYLALADIMHPPLAALVTGAIIIVFAVAVVVVARLLAGRSGVSSLRRGQYPGAGEAFDENKMAAEFGSFLGKQVHEFAGAHAPAAVVVSLAAGFAVGTSPCLRKSLESFLRN
jgi:hypothetical protein